MTLFRWFFQEVLADLATIKQEQQKGFENIMATVATQADIDAITARIAAVATTETQILSEVNAIKTSDQTTIANLQAEIATLQAANPSLDLTAITASVATLETNAAAIVAVTAPPVTQ